MRSVNGRVELRGVGIVRGPTSKPGMHRCAMRRLIRLASKTPDLLRTISEAMRLAMDARRASIVGGDLVAPANSERNISMSFNNTKRYDPPKRKRILIGETL